MKSALTLLVVALVPIAWPYAADVGETKNMQAEYPEFVNRLTKLLESYVSNGAARLEQNNPTTLT